MHSKGVTRILLAQSFGTDSGGRCQNRLVPQITTTAYRHPTTNQTSSGNGTFQDDRGHCDVLREGKIRSPVQSLSVLMLDFWHQLSWPPDQHLDLRGQQLELSFSLQVSIRGRDVVSTCREE